MIDAEVAGLLEAMPPGTFTAEVVESIRTMGMTMPATTLSDEVERTDHEVRGEPRLVIRVHRPRGIQGLLPCVYSIHGGGYVVGDYSLDDERFDRWCPRLNCVGVSVDYRLAPEFPYPAPLEDCYAGLEWVFGHGHELGIDPARIGIAGASAGGGLAAALALLVRDRSELTVAFALLECPMIDDRQATPSSQLDNLPIWNRESNEFGWRSYLGDLYGRADLPPYAAPARAADLSGLPPTHIIVGGADGFRDENIAYAQRLAQAGVPTELHVLPGAPHGLQLFPGTNLARRWDRLILDWLSIAMSTSTV